MNNAVSVEYLLRNEEEQRIIYRFQYCFGQIIQNLSDSMNDVKVEQRVLPSKMRNQIILLMPGISELNLNNLFIFLENFYQSSDRNEQKKIASLLIYMIYDFGINIFGTEEALGSVSRELILLEPKAGFWLISKETLGLMAGRVNQII